MNYSNSSLVNYTHLSPNHSGIREYPITRITIHHMAGNLSVAACGRLFANKKRRASSNYGIDSQGKVGLYVEEKNRSWCSSNADNDNRAVTIEVANDTIGGDWHVSNEALAKLIELCVDICQRNNIERLNYTDDTTGNLTMHNWFAPTTCPGPYLSSKFPYIAEEVNKRLAVLSNPEELSSMVSGLHVGDVIKLKANSTYWNGKTIPAWVFKKTLYYRGESDKGIIFSILKKGAITGVVERSNVIPAAAVTVTPAYRAQTVKVTCDELNIRMGPGIEYPIGGLLHKKDIRIIDAQEGNWGRIRGTEDWINLKYTRGI